MSQYTCPSCKTTQTLRQTPSFSLPPTGGDYEWCETTEELSCPSCQARLDLKVRIWLEDHRVDVLDVRVLPPPPHSWYNARWVSFSPDGERAAIHSQERGLWLMHRKGRAWRGPVPLTSAASNASGVTLQGDSGAWAPDGRFVSALTGAIHDAEGRVLATLPWEHPHLRAIAFGPDAKTVLYSWRELVRQNIFRSNWETGVDALFPDGARKRARLPTHSGVEMSGKSFFSPGGDRFLRCHPTFHGSHNWQLELYQVDLQGDPILTPIASREYPHCEVQAASWDTSSGDILIAYAHPFDKSQPLGTGYGPHGLARLDGDTLEIRHRCHFLPDEARAGWQSHSGKSYYTMHDLHPLRDGKLLLLTRSLYLLSFIKDEVRVRGCFPAITASACVSVDERRGQILAACDGKLFLYSLTNPERPGEAIDLGIQG